MQGSEKRECFENKPQKRANAQRKGLESENYNRMIRIFLLREYLF